MNEVLTPMLAGVVGAALGAIFFGGLWLTVNRSMTSKHVALWFLFSLLLRTGIVMYGFYWIGHVHWQRLIVCLLGFILARLALTKWLGPSALKNPLHSAQEHSHAP